MLVYRNNLIFLTLLNAVFFILAWSIDLKFNLVGITFWFNIFSCIILMLFIMGEKLNIILFFYIFNLIFMGFIPWINYSSGVVFWSNNPFLDYDYIVANLSLWFFNLIFFIFYKGFNFKFTPVLKSDAAPNFIISIIFCFFCLSILLYALGFNLTRLFFRGVDGVVNENNNPILSIFVQLSRMIPAFIFMRYLIVKDYFKAFIILIFVLLCAFPTAITRFMVAFIYLPIFILLIPQLKKAINITIFLGLSIILVFPFLNQFRYYSSDKSLKILPDPIFFNQAHFDAYQNFVEVLRLDFVTYGYQLLGALFFYIPRSFWDDKPFGSGYQIAINNNYNFSNISMPFIGEAYVNFGYLGFILFGLAGGIVRYLDSFYLDYNNFLTDKKFQYMKGVFFCSSLFFMLRGDLMSGLSFMIAGIFAFKIAELI